MEFILGFVVGLVAGIVAYKFVPWFHAKADEVVAKVEPTANTTPSS